MLRASTKNALQDWSDQAYSHSRSSSRKSGGVTPAHDPIMTPRADHTMTVSAPPHPATLAAWIAATVEPGIPALNPAPAGTLRFLFYARASTSEHQDPQTSRAWQLDVAHRLVDRHGTIVGE